MEMVKISVTVKKINDCNTLLDFLNVFYKDKRIKTVRKTTSFFKSHKVMENFWDWLDAQEIPNDKIKSLIADIGEEKKKYLTKNPLIQISFSDENEKGYDDDENTLNFYDEEVCQYN